MSTDDKLILTDAECHTSMYLKLTAYVDAQLQRYRLKNDNKLSMEDTAELRGRIAALKNLQRDLQAALSPPKE